MTVECILQVNLSQPNEHSVNTSKMSRSLETSKTWANSQMSIWFVQDSRAQTSLKLREARNPRTPYKEESGVQVPPLPPGNTQVNWENQREPLAFGLARYGFHPQTIH